jgi:site-specific recombinase XerD
MLSQGTDFYTLSKLMGHRDLKSTMTYAHIIDITRQRAVAKIPKILTTLDDK